MEEIKSNDRIDRISEVSGLTAEYLVVSMVPSFFRSYPERKSFSVRGLFYAECISIAKYLNSQSSQENINYKQIANIYKDVIREGPGDPPLDILDLELADLVFLITIASLETEESHYWDFSFTCKNILTDEDGNPLRDEKGNLKVCNAKNSKRITIEDFDFKKPKVSAGIIPLTYGKDKKENFIIKPVTLRDEIDKISFRESESNNGDLDVADQIPEQVLNYASILKSHNDKPLTFEEKVKLVQFSRAELINQLGYLFEDLTIYPAPIKFKCSQCGYEYSIRVTLTSLRGYPSV